MGAVRPPSRVMLFAAAFSHAPKWLDSAADLIHENFGPTCLISERFAFTETDYYSASMGSPLLKQFFFLEELVKPDALPRVKLTTNDWEDLAASSRAAAVPRPLNLDPGYLDLGKMVLASTKDHQHRLYLGEGIFGEVTLAYEARRWKTWPWTYPDYQRPDVQAVFTAAREQLRQRLR